MMNILINELRKVIISKITKFLGDFEDLFISKVDDLGFEFKCEKEFSNKDDSDYVRYRYSLLENKNIIFTIKVTYSNYTFQIEEYDTHSANKKTKNKIKALKFILLDTLDEMIQSFNES